MTPDDARKQMIGLLKQYKTEDAQKAIELRDSRKEEIKNHYKRLKERIKTEYWRLLEENKKYDRELEIVRTLEGIREAFKHEDAFTEEEINQECHHSAFEIGEICEGNWAQETFHIVKEISNFAKGRYIPNQITSIGEMSWNIHVVDASPPDENLPEVSSPDACPQDACPPDTSPPLSDGGYGEIYIDEYQPNFFKQEAINSQMTMSSSLLNLLDPEKIPKKSQKNREKKLELGQTSPKKVDRNIYGESGFGALEFEVNNQKLAPKKMKEFKYDSTIHGKRSINIKKSTLNPKAVEFMNPSSIGERPPKRSTNEIEIHQARTIDITRCREAKLVVKIDDKFDKPMGIGGGRNKVFIPNSLDKAGQVFIYSHRGDYVATLNPPGRKFVTPTSAVEISKNGETFYYVKDNVQVFIFKERMIDMEKSTSNIEFIKAFGLHELGKMPVGLSLINDILYIVHEGFKISGFTLDGKKLSTCDVNWRFSRISNSPCNPPRIRYANSHDKSLFLACMNNFVVFESNPSGEILRIFGEGQGNTVSRMSQPAGMTFDRYGNFIIADSKNHRLLIFDRKDGKSRVLRYNAKFKRPSDVHLHDSGILSVASLDGNIYLLELQ